MAVLVNFEIKELPKVKLVGKEIRPSQEEQMKGNNPLPAFWGKCFQEGAFAPLESQDGMIFDPSYVGIMLDWERGDGMFSYIVGMLMLEDAAVPEGYYSAELPAARVAVGYIKGKEHETYAVAHQFTEQKLKEAGYTCEKMHWCGELYNCPRFTEPDAQGEVVLDYYIPLD